MSKRSLFQQPIAQKPAYPSDYISVLAERRESVREELKRILPEEASNLIWEVGCGHGHFLTAFASAHPTQCCIGVDIESSRIVRAIKKRDRAKLKNLHFIRAEARIFLEELPPAARVAAIFILFPDPWPKTRHHKHRVIQSGFLDALAHRSTKDARLYFRTDHAPYFAEACVLLNTAPGWQLADEPWPFEFETVFQSRAVQHQSLVAKRRAT